MHVPPEAAAEELAEVAAAVGGGKFGVTGSFDEEVDKKQPSPCSLNFAALPSVLTDCHVGGLEAAEIEPAVLENDWQLSPAALFVGGNLELPLAAEKNWPLGWQSDPGSTPTG